MNYYNGNIKDVGSLCKTNEKFDIYTLSSKYYKVKNMKWRDIPKQKAHCGLKFFGCHIRFRVLYEVMLKLFLRNTRNG